MEIWKKHKRLWIAMGLSSMIALTGCGGDGENTGMQADPASKESQKEVSQTPVHLKLLAEAPYMSDEEFPLLIADPLKKKYPNITVEIIRPGNGANIEDLVAAGTVPDLIILYNGTIGRYLDLGLLTDLRPIFKTHKVDLNRFKPGMVEGYSMNGEVYGLPYTMNINATYYNQDIFDKFGVPYPKDGMSWEDAIALGRRLTREDNGVQYRGISYDRLFRPSYALSLPLVDEKTNKALLNTDSWKKVFSLAKSIGDIPGNREEKEGVAVNDFLNKRILAMNPTINLFSRLEEPTQQGLRWDLAQYPSFKEHPDTFTFPDLHEIMVTSSSQHKEEATRVVETLTSDEVQFISARKTGRVSALANKEIEQQFAADMPFMKGKHVESIFKSKSAKTPYLSIYDAEIKKIVIADYPKYQDNAIDLNTYARQIEEKANQYIAGVGNK